jgi:hypothetical protein
MFLQQPEEQWISVITFDNNALCSERGPYLMGDGAVHGSTLPTPHLMNYHPDFDTECFSERPGTYSPPHHHNMALPHGGDREAGPLPIQILTPTSTIHEDWEDTGAILPFSATEDRVFPITASGFQRYDRDITQYVYHNSEVYATD